jgi:hypothetical protein
MVPGIYECFYLLNIANIANVSGKALKQAFCKTSGRFTQHEKIG